MRILILEDEPIIAIDLEDIVSACTKAEIILASTPREALKAVDRGIDFALLDVRLCAGRETSLPVAAMLRERGVPFCFVSSFAGTMPAAFMNVPRVEKPFRPRQIEDVLPLAA